MNEYIVGDNLPVMRQLPSGCMDLVYLDPPFNSGRDYSKAGGTFTDIWGSRRIDGKNDEIDGISADADAVCDLAERLQDEGTAAYLEFMAGRLAEIKRLLKDEGAVYLHCDSTASHYLKLLMDAVFGAGNYRNHIAWKRSSSKGHGAKTSRTYGSVLDTILFYAASPKHVIQVPKTKDGSAVFKHRDAKGSYRAVTPLYGDASLLGGCSRFQWKGHDPEHGWRVSMDTLERLDGEKRIHYTSKGRPYRKEYEDEWLGVSATCLWDDIALKNTETVGYPTQKPVELLERIVVASTPKGGSVLDPFAGSGTTLVAAKRNDREWMGIDISEDAAATFRNRMRKRSLVDFFA